MIRIVQRKRSAREEDPYEFYERLRKLRKANDSSIIQINTNEKDNGSIEDQSSSDDDDDLLENIQTLNLEADYGYGLIKFHLPVSQATYANVEKEISKKLGLSLGTCSLEYLDDYEEWILVDTEEEMLECIRCSMIIRSSTKEEMGGCINSLRIQLRVRLSQKLLIGPLGILSI